MILCFEAHELCHYLEAEQFAVRVTCWGSSHERQLVSGTLVVDIQIENRAEIQNPRSTSTVNLRVQGTQHLTWRQVMASILNEPGQSAQRILGNLYVNMVVSQCIMG